MTYFSAPTTREGETTERSRNESCWSGALSESKLTRSCGSSKHERFQRSVGVRRDPLVLLQVRGDDVLHVSTSEEDLAEAETLHLRLRERLRLLLLLDSFPVNFGRVSSVQVLL